MPNFRKPFRAWAAPAAAVVLAGCSGSPPLVDHLSAGRVQGDADRVSVQGGRWEALPLAVAHCSRFGRSAQFDRLDGDHAIYRCVKS